jgi:hypothetical protein
MRIFVIILLAGCHFGVNAVDVDQSVPDDGGGGDDGALDANVELGPMPMDANVFDFAVVRDLALKVPDGATPRKTGYPCGAAAECDSGFCIDGYCCETLCDIFDPANKCRACNVPGSEGRCVFAEDGTDPRGLCDGSDATTCGQDGLCDGRGNCRLWGAGTLCGPGACVNNAVTAPPACDGAGRCVPDATSTPCDPYACEGMACDTTCTASGGCAPGATCSFNQCNMKSALGAACASAGECASGLCEKGVCCSTACSAPCLSCALPGARGLCLPIPAGTDPLNECAAQSRSSCGLDGSCDGLGACRMWSSTTPCAPRTCSGDSTVAPRFCDGAGTCLSGIAAPCNPYTCETATGVCYGPPCSSNAQCAVGGKCQPNGKCLPP